MTLGTNLAEASPSLETQVPEQLPRQVTRVDEAEVSAVLIAGSRFADIRQMSVIAAA